MRRRGRKGTHLADVESKYESQVPSPYISGCCSYILYIYITFMREVVMGESDNSRVDLTRIEQIGEYKEMKRYVNKGIQDLQLYLNQNPAFGDKIYKQKSILMKLERKSSPTTPKCSESLNIIVEECRVNGEKRYGGQICQEVANRVIIGSEKEEERHFSCPVLLSSLSREHITSESGLCESPMERVVMKTLENERAWRTGGLMGEVKIGGLGNIVGNIGKYFHVGRESPSNHVFHSKGESPPIVIKEEADSSPRPLRSPFASPSCHISYALSPFTSAPNILTSPIILYPTSRRNLFQQTEKWESESTGSVKKNKIEIKGEEEISGEAVQREEKRCMRRLKVERSGENFPEEVDQNERDDNGSGLKIRLNLNKNTIFSDIQNTSNPIHSQCLHGTHGGTHDGTHITHITQITPTTQDTSSHILQLLHSLNSRARSGKMGHFNSFSENHEKLVDIERGEYDDLGIVCCNCKKSGCLKLYCECFAHGRLCNDCNCSNCYNNSHYESKRAKAIMAVLEKNPGAFVPKIAPSLDGIPQKDGNVGLAHTRGCNCKKSGCSKKYCECYQSRIPCTYLCKCLDCVNRNIIDIKEEDLMQTPQLKINKQEYIKDSISTQKTAPSTICKTYSSRVKLNLHNENTPISPYKEEEEEDLLNIENNNSKDILGLPQKRLQMEQIKFELSLDDEIKLHFEESQRRKEFKIRKADLLKISRSINRTKS